MDGTVAMNFDTPDFRAFLIRAKQATYASGGAGLPDSSRPQSHDLAYAEAPYYYFDTYLGGFAFAGEEAVWCEGAPVWAMNYYGTMTVESIPDGFSDFLKHALRQVPLDAPYRGPERVEQGAFRYDCRWEGDITMYRGEETISLDGQVIYRLYFHGGGIR